MGTLSVRINIPKGEIINIRDRLLNIYTHIDNSLGLITSKSPWRLGLFNGLVCGSMKSLISMTMTDHWKYTHRLGLRCEVIKWAPWTFRLPLRVKSLTSVSDYWTYTHKDGLVVLARAWDCCWLWPPWRLRPRVTGGSGLVVCGGLKSLISVTEHWTYSQMCVTRSGRTWRPEITGITNIRDRSLNIMIYSRRLGRRIIWRVPVKSLLATPKREIITYPSRLQIIKHLLTHTHSHRDADIVRLTVLSDSELG